MKLPTLGKLMILVTRADSAILIMMERERDAMLNECFIYDAQARPNGHAAGREALQRPGAAMTLYWKNGKIAVTDGTYAETKEQLSEILALEARDLNRAIELISQHAGVKLRTVGYTPGSGSERDDP